MNTDAAIMSVMGLSDCLDSDLNSTIVDSPCSLEEFHPLEAAASVTADDHLAYQQGG